MNISSERLELIEATAELIRQEISDPQALGQYLSASVPVDGWGVYYWVTLSDADAPRALVGSGGFMSKPIKGSTVEIGYGTLGEFQGRGYAAEAVSALTRWASARSGILRVIAEALPGNLASVRVLQKSGFRDIGPGEEEGTRRFECTC